MCSSDLVASITKLFTWTAVMQQVEEGKLDLSTDVNQYLKEVQIPATFDRPITIKDLMTHTPGFEDVVVGVFTRDARSVPSLTEFLRSHMPARVRPPGAVASYSNEGTCLAGLAAADVAGTSWEDLIEKRILLPLGMKHSMVKQPPPEELPADLSKGYCWQSGRFAAQGFEYEPEAPAGVLSTTAGDAARFMLAHLQDGRLGDARILRAETARRMREPLFRHAPAANAMCYGLWESDWNGLRIVGHGGDTFWFQIGRAHV